LQDFEYTKWSDKSSKKFLLKMTFYAFDDQNKIDIWFHERGE